MIRSPSTAQFLCVELRVDLQTSKHLRLRGLILGLQLGPERQLIFVIDIRGQLGVLSGSVFNGFGFYSGFWSIDAADSQIALELAQKGSKACNRKVYLRPSLQSSISGWALGPSDFDLGDSKDLCSGTKGDTGISSNKRPH